MKNIAKKIQNKNNEYQKQCLKHKYSKGIEFVIVGSSMEGYKLISRCLKRKKWETLKHIVGKPRYGLEAQIAFLRIISYTSSLIESLSQYRIKTNLRIEIE